jgi:outer membrane receptor protein involved in Fe transport
LSSNGDVSFTNVPNAKVIGIEFEVRRRLDHTGIWLLQNLTLGGNLTLVKSEVDIAAAELAVYRAFDPDYPDTRDFQGQSPYVVNCDLTYSDYEAGTEISLLYNRFGDRLIETVYSKPDVYERAQDMLNLTASQQLWGPVTIRGSVKNILGAEYRETQKFLENEYTRYHYTLGTSWSLGLRYSI